MAARPFYLHLCLSICAVLAYVPAGLQYCAIKGGLIKMPSHFINAPGGVYTNLRNLWHTRIARRMISLLVRTYLRTSILRLVNFNIDLPEHTGCIYITCHSPWRRLLVQWCLENKFALMIAGAKSATKGRHIQRFGKGFTELREITNHLKNKGRIIIVADSFNNKDDCPVTFLEQNRNASLFPVRLAKVARVPIIVTIASFKDGAITIAAGPQFTHTNLNGNLAATMQQIITAVGCEIKKDPCIYR